MTTVPTARKRLRPKVPEKEPRSWDKSEHEHEDLRVPYVGGRIYVWDVVVRSTHWLIAGAIVVLSITGYYIGKPFLAGADSGSFTMAWFKTVHFYAAIVFSLSVLVRIIWMFVSTNHWASWHQFVPVTKARRRDLVGTFLFYTFVRARPPPATGHNALAGLTYVVIFTLYVVVILTGIGLYAIDADVSSYMSSFDFLLSLFGGAQTARWIHHVIMWLLIAFTVHHVYSALLMSRTEKRGVMDSMFSGYKYLPCNPEELEEGEGEEQDHA